MKHLTHWILLLATLVTVASFTGAWSAPQDPTAKPAKKLERPQGQGGKKQPGQQGRAEKQNSIKKVLPTLKTSLVEAIGLAEKESTGKAYSASVEVREGKPMIQVSLFVNDKHTMTSVDPETKKVTILGKPAEGPGGEGAGDGKGEGEGEEGG